MAFSYRDLFCGGTTFCCCLKVRMGVLIMAVLGMLFSGFLTILLWFEVSTTPDLSHKTRAICIVAGLVETLLFVVSMLGFVGTVVRKQLFVQIYAYFLYVHFLLNLGVAAFLLFELVHVSTTDQNAACQLAVHNSNAQSQCTSILQVGVGIYGGIAAGVLLAEMYALLIVARYVNQIQREKRNTRASRMTQNAFRMSARQSARYSTIKDTAEFEAIPSRAASSTAHDEDFDPYDPYYGAPGLDYKTPSSTAYDPHPASPNEEHSKTID